MCIRHSLTAFIIFTLVLVQEAKGDVSTPPQATQEVIVEDEKNRNEDNHLDVDSLVTLVPRRFIDDLTDEQWHVAHLKKPKENGRKSGCKRTFEDQLKRYRKDMIADAGAIEFVAVDPLPEDEKDLAGDACKISDEFVQPTRNDEISEGVTRSMSALTDGQDLKKPFIKSRDVVHPVTESQTENSDPELDTLLELNVRKNKDNTKETPDNTTVNKLEENDDLHPGIEEAVENAEVVKNNENNETIVEAIPTETYSNSTQHLKEGITTQSPSKKGDDKDKLRRSEYMFGSVEYYDEKLDFDASGCSIDSVDVITLEEELLRDYDAECILTLEWKFLE